MKLLIIGDNTRFIHLKSFCKSLEKFDFESELLFDMDFLSGFFDSPITKMRNKKKFKETLSKSNPDFILLDRFSELGLEISKSRIPFGILLRGNFWEEIESYKEKSDLSVKAKLSISKYKKLVEKCFQEADVIFPISKYLENEVKERIPNKRIELFYADGRDPQEWNESEGMKLEHPCVGLLQGAGIWNKTKEVLTLEKILKDLPDVNFYWAGDGKYRNDVLKVLEPYKNFKWLGKIDYPNKVKQFLTEIDVFALFSGLEGFGQSVIEAQLMKKPTICSNVGGIPEIVKDGYNGFLIEKNDHTKWKNKISEILNDKNLAKEISQNGYDLVSSSFNWDVIAKRFFDILISNPDLTRNKDSNQ